MRITLVVALGFACAGGACAPVDYCEADGVGSDSALFASQTFVRERLRAPASAQFPTSSTAPSVSVTKAGECTFVVMSYVDSQNAFGAMLRTTYVAEVTPDSDGRYSLGRFTMD